MSVLGPAPDDGARTDSTELVLLPGGSSPAIAVPIDLVALFLDGRNPRTLAAYARDLADFARFAGAPDASSAVDLLILAGQGNANAAAFAWRADMAKRKLAPATIARRLAALRALLKLARQVGRVNWALDVDPPKVEKLRDTRGPGADGWAKMLAAAELAGDGPKARRDRAIIRLLRERALRRGEVVALDHADFRADARRPSLEILGKGRNQRDRVVIGPGTSAAVVAWIRARGDHPGPLFVRLDPGDTSRTSRLTAEAVRRIVAAIAAAAGIEGGCRPHGLRHEGITAALDAGRDIRDVAKFSRHKNIQTLLIYDDRRTDVGGDIAHELGS